MASNEPSEEIFILGVPRSGTGILQNLMRFSPELAWVTPATNAMTGFTRKHGLPLGAGFAAAGPLDLVTRVVPQRWRPKFLRGPYDGTLADDAKIPADEGSRIWCWHVPEYDHDRLTADDVTAEARRFYPSVVDHHLEYFSAERFLSKRPANTLRLPFLDEIFPDAVFLHLTRDPRATGASILRRKHAEETDWWGAEPPGWRDQLTRSDSSQIGWQIRTIVETLRLDADERGLGGRFVEVSYEDLTEKPARTLSKVYDAVGLAPDQLEPLEGFLDQLENRNAGWEEAFEGEDLEGFLDEVGGLHEEGKVPEGAVKVRV